MTNRIAVLDWDGTVRRDFTIRSWARFLAARAVISESTVSLIDGILAQYGEGIIYHDAAAELTANLLAQRLRGCQQQTVLSLAEQYADTDHQYLYPFASPLFEYLTTHGIGITIISGAPSEVIATYCTKFQFLHIFALEFGTSEGLYTGNVEANPGVAHIKKALVNELVHQRNLEIVLSAGNSWSDIPLLEAAPLSLVVDNPTLVTSTITLHLSGKAGEVAMLTDFLGKELQYGV